MGCARLHCLVECPLAGNRLHSITEKNGVRLLDLASLFLIVDGRGLSSVRSRMGVGFRVDTQFAPLAQGRVVKSMVDQTCEIDQLLRLAAQGDPASWQALLGASRRRLHRMVACRLDHRLQGGGDPSDVLQDAYFDSAAASAGDLERPE